MSMISDKINAQFRELAKKQDEFFIKALKSDEKGMVGFIINDQEYCVVKDELLWNLTQKGCNPFPWKKDIVYLNGTPTEIKKLRGQYEGLKKLFDKLDYESVETVKEDDFHRDD